MGSAAEVHGIEAEPVVAFPLLAIRKNFIRLSRFLEPGGGVRVSRMAVRVVLDGQLALGSRDFLVGGFAGDPQDLVVIAFACHRAHSPKCR